MTATTHLFQATEVRPAAGELGSGGATTAGRERPRVVIVGAGFGGLNAARTLARAPVDVMLVDRRNYHLFQPLLYQVATAGLSPADIAMPVRRILSEQKNAAVVLGRVDGVDLQAKTLSVEGRTIAYDFLVLATGARHGYFGKDDWEAHAPGLKKIEDATEIRRRMLLSFEHAETAESEAAQRALLNFVIVGGGPTGVELAGAIAELARRALASDFRNIDPRSARVILVEAGPRLLAPYPEALSAKARVALERLGVEVRTGARVTGCDVDGVELTDGAGGAPERIASRCVIWAAGVIASPAARWLGAAADRSGRVVVEPDLSVPGHPDVFVIGDTALATGEDGKPVPGIAPAAKQMGYYVARVIAARVTGKPVREPFRYKHLGNLATIGRAKAVADFGRVSVTGALAWWLWGLVHVYFLIGFRNRLAVMLDWAWAYVTWRRGARLITGPTGAPPG